MPLNPDIISQRVIGKLDKIGIRSKVGGSDSETALMIRLIVSELVFALQAEAIVVTTVTTAGSPTVHTGTGTGSIK